MFIKWLIWYSTLMLQVLCMILALIFLLAMLVGPAIIAIKTLNPYWLFGYFSFPIFAFLFHTFSDFVDELDPGDWMPDGTWVGVGNPPPKYRPDPPPPPPPPPPY